MIKSNPTRFMIMDACVLIDYMNGEPDLFKLISSHIGSIYVAAPILEEVDSIKSIEELEDLGLIRNASPAFPGLLKQGRREALRMDMKYGCIHVSYIHPYQYPTV